MCFLETRLREYLKGFTEPFENIVNRIFCSGKKYEIKDKSKTVKIKWHCSVKASTRRCNSLIYCIYIYISLERVGTLIMYAFS